MFITTIFIIVFSFPTAYFILFIGKTLSNSPGVQIGSADGWLSFIGSLFGGVITMLAVLFTFRYQKFIDTMKSVPSFSIEMITDSKNLSAKVINKNDILFTNVIRFELKNTSTHIAKDFKIKSVEFGPIGSKTIKTKKDIEIDELLKSNLAENILNPNQVIVIPIYTNINLISDKYCNFILEVEFYDFLKFKKFSYLITCFIITDFESVYRNNIDDYLDKYIPCQIQFITWKSTFLNN